jgi:hypothetical protein
MQQMSFNTIGTFYKNAYGADDKNYIARSTFPALFTHSLSFELIMMHEQQNVYLIAYV